MSCQKSKLGVCSLRHLMTLVAFALCCTPALAHKPDHSYIYLDVTEQGMSGKLELRLDALEQAIGANHPMFLGVPGDSIPLGSGVIEGARVGSQGLSEYLTPRLQFSFDDKPARVSFPRHQIVDIEKVARYVVVEFTVDTPQPVPDRLDINYAIFLDEDDEHRGGLVIANNYKTGVVDNDRYLSHFFTPSRTAYELNLLGESVLKRLWNFVLEGIVHIWMGLDHVLFLISLLLPAVLVRQGGRWYPEDDLKKATVNVLIVVTVFTLAHSLTLFAAMMGWIVLSARLVESIIALSVLMVAIDNVRPIFGRYKWVLVFAFGLFHGLGFASVLQYLTLDFKSKIIGLVGFNVGVEIGQVIVVAVLFPLLFLLRHRRYQQLVLIPGSAIIGLFACWWLVTRLFEFDTSWTSF